MAGGACELWVVGRCSYNNTPQLGDKVGRMQQCGWEAPTHCLIDPPSHDQTCGASSCTTLIANISCQHHCMLLVHRIAWESTTVLHVTPLISPPPPTHTHIQPLYLPLSHLDQHFS